VQGTVAPLVVGAADHQLLTLLGDGDAGRQLPVQVPWGPLTLTELPLRVTVTLEGTGMGERPMRDISLTSFCHAEARAAGYQTWQSTSPPRCFLRASRSVTSPWLVESTATPMPPSTRGCRRPGRRCAARAWRSA
jgi:hypothetical protein